METSVLDTRGTGEDGLDAVNFASITHAKMIRATSGWLLRASS